MFFVDLGNYQLPVATNIISLPIGVSVFLNKVKPQNWEFLGLLT
ncbi:hypothetical protein NOS3756_32510 [Nostoc sp. NIES-3756]|nr:hypothetical protein NOS3756_32510 [Nostoc sp. NIES-3756]BAY37975.1 hypothetical protein NIES2111_23180 [Nostoc sp. NIES-2111]